MSRFSIYRSTFPIYDAAETWKERCLLSNGSLLSEDKALWTKKLLSEVDPRLFIDKNTKIRNTFLSKLKHQISETTPNCKKLIAECLWILFLFSSNIKAETKRSQLVEIWSWSGAELDLNQKLLNDATLDGIGSTGTAFSTYRWKELILLLHAMQDLKHRNVNERAEILWDPWAFTDWFFSTLPDARNRQLGHILSHLLFPDFFERITSETHKCQVLSWFHKTPVTEVSKRNVTEIDRALLSLRGRIEREKEMEIDFYEKNLASQWLRNKWFITWNPSERSWNSMLEHRSVTAAGEQVTVTWKSNEEKIKKGDRIFVIKVDGLEGNIIASGIVEKSRYIDNSIKQNISKQKSDNFVIEIEFDTIREADTDDVINISELQNYDPNIKINLKSREIKIDWSIARFLEAKWHDLRKISDYPSSAPKKVTRSEDDLLDSSTRSNNLILYGPPGTGKTYTLMKDHLPRYRGDDGDRFEFITFHQNYTYEDFVEGIRPTTIGGHVHYGTHWGVLRQICERARRSPDLRFALFIDEISRGNVEKIFGELVTLLEMDKRIQTDSAGNRIPECKGLEVTLPYSGEKFGVPANLDVICTMNTTDGSVSHIISILKRRFEFKEFMPNPKMLGSIGCDDGESIDLQSLLLTINSRLTYLLDRDKTLGHSYFMKVRSFDDLRRVFANEILPLFQELFYDDLMQIRYVFSDQVVDEELQLVRERVQNVGSLFPNADRLNLGDSQTFDIIPETEITPAAIRKIYKRPE